MRTTLLFLVFAALGVSSAGCSIVYRGSQYQGGARNDAGVPEDTSAPPADTGTPIDMGAPPDDANDNDAFSTACTRPTDCPVGQWCDTGMGLCFSGCDEDADCMGVGVCDSAGHTCGCSASTQCPADYFCNGTMCSRCDNDDDGYFAAGAPAVRCARPGHLDGEDCNDDNNTVHPLARPDCSTPTVESCTLPITFDIAGAGVTEVGVSTEHVLFEDLSPNTIIAGPIWVGAGDDQPLMPSGVGGGFVGFVGSDGSNRIVYGVPLQLDGAPGTPEILFNDLQVGQASFTRTTSSFGGSSGSQQLVLSVVEVAGRANMGMRVATLGHPPQAFGGVMTSAYSDLPLAGGAGVSVAGVNAANVPSIVGILSSGSAPYLVAGAPGESARTGGANVIGGTWMAGAESAVIWAASPSAIGVWNGTEPSRSPSTVDLSALTSTAPVQQVLPQFRGDLASRASLGLERFIAVVPVASTTMPPFGRLAIVRWSWPSPATGDSTAAHLSAPGLTVHELDLGPTPHLNGAAGVAVGIVDDTHAFVVYQDGGDVFLAAISVDVDPSSTVEDAPRMPILHAAAGESFVGLDLEAGFYDDGTGHAGVGRVVVAGSVERASGGTTTTRSIRVRALEACVVLP